MSMPEQDKRYHIVDIDSGAVMRSQITTAGYWSRGPKFCWDCRDVVGDHGRSGSSVYIKKRKLRVLREKASRCDCLEMKISRLLIYKDRAEELERRLHEESRRRREAERSKP